MATSESYGGSLVSCDFLWKVEIFAFPLDVQAEVRRLARDALLNQCTQGHVTGDGGSVQV